MINFASDNYAGTHPRILEALAAANAGPAPAYGNDDATKRARERFKEHFGAAAEAFLVFNGSAANVLCLQAMTRPHHAIFCARTAHINEHECNAPERFTGCKLIAIETRDGKLTPELIDRHYRGIGDEHMCQPRVVSITQATELGTVYTSSETRALAEYAHGRGMYLHVDGARISNAAASLGKSLRALTTDVGVDALSFGATKNGAMGVEAVVLLNASLAGEFGFVRKQSLQLASKMRFLAVQLETLLTDDLWLKNASHANAMARKLESQLAGTPGLELTQPVQSNAVFARLPGSQIEALQKEFYFHVWDEHKGSGRPEVRWMASFDTTEDEILHFCARIRETALSLNT